PGGEKVISKGDLGDAEAVIEEVEGKYRGETGQKDDLEALPAHGLVNGPELPVSADLFLHPFPQQRTAQKRRGRDPKEAAGARHYRSREEAESEARSQSKDRAREKEHASGGVNHDQVDRSPRSHAPCPIEESGQEVLDRQHGDGHQGAQDEDGK